ncbi:hypothetical protein YC2023_054006 [Brassica napus]
MGSHTREESSTTEPLRYSGGLLTVLCCGILSDNLPLLPENQKGIKGGSRNKVLRTHHLTSGSRVPFQVRNIRGSEHMGDGCGHDSEITTKEERKLDIVAVTIQNLTHYDQIGMFLWSVTDRLCPIERGATSGPLDTTGEISRSNSAKHRIKKSLSWNPLSVTQKYLALQGGLAGVLTSASLKQSSILQN